jgi:hypothetical protein
MMSLPMQVALTVGPLAIYFFIIGAWQSGKHPRVVSGPVDFAVLVFGVSGLLTVGPIGQVLMGLVFGHSPGPLAWGLWLLFLALWARVFSYSASRRVVVYNLEPERLVREVGLALDELPRPRFTPRVGGFEATEDGTAVQVDGSRRLRVATVDSRGRDPQALIRALRPVLRERLSAIRCGPTRVTWGLFALSWLTMLAPLAAFLLTEPTALAAVRALWMRITRGA